ncbi:hypothetical protein L1I30_05995 [Gillisia sp. M10.2A]|uniref:Peptidase M56 domain-containing protein n=1 Tax=Gillisia lutea TaxID=2909668 RepID=A0ABS9EEA1_9FLAO|nr:hypothetical protein [Gillisia lutea]
MIVLVNKYLLAKGYNGVSLWPFIVLKHPSLKNDPVFLNHERIHLKQQQELLIVGFYIWYGLEYFYRLYQYKHRFLAYRNISFEREAYANEGNLEYCKNRRSWNFYKYIHKILK